MIRTSVLPSFCHLTLREVTPGRVGRALAATARASGPDAVKTGQDTFRTTVATRLDDPSPPHARWLTSTAPPTHGCPQMSTLAVRWSAPGPPACWIGDRFGRRLRYVLAGVAERLCWI